MHPPSHTRRILKSTGTSLAILVLLTWALSLFYEMIITPTWSTKAQIIHGGVLIESVTYNFVPDDSTFEFFRIAAHPYRQFGFVLPKAYDETFKHESLELRTRALFTPFWIAFALTAIPTAWLWHRDRRRIRPGCCLRCGYDLTGNTRGVCSECGLAKPPPSTV